MKILVLEQKSVAVTLRTPQLHTDGSGIESRPVTDCLGKAQHKNKNNLLLSVPHMRPEVLMVMTRNSAVLWDVMQTGTVFGRNVLQG